MHGGPQSLSCDSLTFDVIFNVGLNYDSFTLVSNFIVYKPLVLVSTAIIKKDLVGLILTLVTQVVASF